MFDCQVTSTLAMDSYRQIFSNCLDTSQAVINATEGGVPIESLYDAIVVTGIISTETWSADIAQVGYKIKAIGVAPFEL